MMKSKRVNIIVDFCLLYEAALRDELDRTRKNRQKTNANFHCIQKDEIQKLIAELNNYLYNQMFLSRLKNRRPFVSALRVRAFFLCFIRRVYTILMQTWKLITIRRQP